MTNSVWLRKKLRTAFGVVLFIAWGIETIIWIASTVVLTARGEISSSVTAVVTVVLLTVLAGMEGLEVAVITQWRRLWPASDPSDLARWLSARQLFVALIVTAVTLVARRSALVIPETSIQVTNGLGMDVFVLTWTGFAVLWLAQIAPKTLAATNPRHYLGLLRGTLFPLVQGVRIMGISQPGEWVAGWISVPIGWSASMSAQSIGQTKDGDNISLVWRSLGSNAPQLMVEPEVPEPEYKELKLNLPDTNVEMGGGEAARGEPVGPPPL